MLLYGCEELFGGIWHKSNFWVLSNTPSQPGFNEFDYDIVEVYKNHMIENIPGYQDTSAWAVKQEDDWRVC